MSAGRRRGRFGYGPEPSKLIDAGQWYLILGKYLEAGAAIQNRTEPLDVRAGDEITERYYRAWAALQEIVKFIPEGTEELPESAIWTDRGRLVREQRGDQLNRTALVQMSEQLWTALRSFHDVYTGRAAKPEG